MNKFIMNYSTIRDNAVRLMQCAFVVFLVALFPSCLKQDISVGDDLLPNKDKLTMTIGGFEDFDIATLSVDSFRTDEFSEVFLGSMISDRYGRITSVYTTELLHTITNPDSLASKTIVIDSVRLRLSSGGYYGDMDSPMTISMYELDSNFRKPTNLIAYDLLEEGDEYNRPYYSNFQYWKYIKKTPLITFTTDLSKIIASSNYINVHLPKSYAQKFFDAPKEIYEQDSLFRKMFKGYCFTVLPVYNNGVLFRIAPNNSHIEISYHDTNKKDDKGVYVKMAFLIDFSHIVNSNLYNQIGLNIKHEFEYADPSIGVKQNLINDTINVQELSYLSGFGGLMTRIRMPEDKIKEIKNKIPEGSLSGAILVTNATLSIPLWDTSLSGMNNSISAIGMYYNYCIPTYMPGYEPFEEEFDEATFGGTLDRSLKVYKMNITDYIQELLNGKTKKMDLHIAPSEAKTFAAEGAILGNSKSNPIKLDIVYVVSK